METQKTIQQFNILPNKNFWMILEKLESWMACLFPIRVERKEEKNSMSIETGPSFEERERNQEVVEIGYEIIQGA